MNYLTRFGLNLLQKTKLDYFTMQALNNRICGPLLLKYGWQKRNYISYYKQYQDWKEKLNENKIIFKDKKILDIGAGSSIGLGYFFLRDNYKYWLSTDLHHNLKTDRKLIKREISLIKKIHKNYDCNIFGHVKIRGDSVAFGERLDFRRLQIASLEENLIGNFDIIISSAVLEHIPGDLVEKTMAYLKDYLKAGGLMIHEIDLRDHVNTANPFAFYKFSQESWNKLTYNTIFYSNRLRLIDYLKIFNKLNFKIRFSEVDSKILPPGIQIDNFFQKYNKEELEAIRVFIILEKP